MWQHAETKRLRSCSKVLHGYRRPDCGQRRNRNGIRYYSIASSKYELIKGSAHFDQVILNLLSDESPRGVLSGEKGYIWITLCVVTCVIYVEYFSCWTGPLQRVPFSIGMLLHHWRIVFKVEHNRSEKFHTLIRTNNGKFAMFFLPPENEPQKTQLWRC